jgi:outer membrane lipoprotein-sorting protein
MAPYGSDGSTTGGETEERGAGRRRAARYVVPVTVMGVAAATIGLVPALADSGDPDLPAISAQRLVEKIAASDTQRLSGTVKISTDLGLPDLGGLESGLMSGAASPSAADGDGGSAADPTAHLTELASGTHTLRVAADGPDRQKVSLLQDAAEYSLIHDGTDVWGYDSASNEVYHSTVPAAGGSGDAAGGRRGELPATPKELAQEALKAVDATTSVTVDGTAQVAGRDAYRLVVEPKQKDSTVGSITIAVDAKTGTPLKFTLSPAAGGAAVVDAGFTQVSFAKPDASTFDFTPPKGAKVTEGNETGTGDTDGTAAAPRATEKALDGGKGLTGAKGLDGAEVIGEGWNAIATFDIGTEGLPTADAGGAFDGFLNSLGDQVKGSFGTGTVFSTRLVNALLTDDGTVYVGAVTKDALVEAADAGK